MINVEGDSNDDTASGSYTTSETCETLPQCESEQEITFGIQWHRAGLNVIVENLHFG